MMEIYLTTQPCAQLRYEQVDNEHSDVFSAGLYQLSLSPVQSELLEVLNETRDDVKFLRGPPGTGKTMLLQLRALQWIKHFSARQIFILQTRQHGTAASCLVEYQLQQTLDAQQQRARQSDTDTQSAQCTFTCLSLSELCREDCNEAAGRDDVIEDVWKEKLYTALGLQQRDQSDTAIHIVADGADGNVVAAVYDWLKMQDVTTVRLWAASMLPLQDTENMSASLQSAICHVTEPLRCPDLVVQEVVKASQIEKGEVASYDGSQQLTDGPPVVQLRHYLQGRNGHARALEPWRCSQCARDIMHRLQSLHVDESDEGHTSLSANDVFILGSVIDCDAPDDDVTSPAPLINFLQDKGFNVRTLSSTSLREDFMSVVKQHGQPAAVTVSQDRCVEGLERKVVIYCESDNEAYWTGRLEAFSRTTSVLIYIDTEWSS